MEPGRYLAADEARAAARRATEELARDARVRLVYLFGSAADPTRRCVRDIDLALLTDAPPSLQD